MRFLRKSRLSFCIQPRTIFRGNTGVPRKRSPYNICNRSHNRQFHNLKESSSINRYRCRNRIGEGYLMGGEEA